MENDMKKIKFLPIFLILVIMTSVFLAPSALALEEPELSCPSVLVLDRDTGEVLLERNADSKVYPASITKIMTVLLAVEAIENGQAFMTDEVTASANVTFDLVADGSSAGIMVGETMTLESLLYAAMLSSANEACNIIAEHIGGSIPDFVDMMNERAQELGCKATHFVNTHGLPDDNHYTTARDFSMIALEASRHDLFMTLCSTPTISIPATNLSGERTLKNSNALICPDGIYGSQYIYEYANGIKTGHTSAAGYCLISTANKERIHILASVFGGTESWPGPIPEYSNFSDSIKLYEWVFNNFAFREVLRSTDAVTSIPVDMGANADSVVLRPEKAISALLPNDSDLSNFSLSVSYDNGDGSEPILAPISAGDKLGQVTLIKNGISYGTVNLVAATGIDLSRGEYIKAQIKATTDSTAFKLILFAVIIIVLAYLALVITYRVRRIRHLRAMRMARLQKARQERLDREEQLLKEMEEPKSVPVKPAVSYFKEVDITEVPEKTAAQLREEQAERDYFEEFFKNI